MPFWNSEPGGDHWRVNSLEPMFALAGMDGGADGAGKYMRNSITMSYDYTAIGMPTILRCLYYKLWSIWSSSNAGLGCYDTDVCPEGLQ